MCRDARSVLELLATDPHRIRELLPEEVAVALVEVAAIQAALAARLAAPLAAEVSVPEPRENGGDWITPDEAAKLTGVDRRTIYGWSRRLDWRPFTRRLSRKVLRIERSGFVRWLESRQETSSSASTSRVSCY